MTLRVQLVRAPLRHAWPLGLALALAAGPALAQPETREITHPVAIHAGPAVYPPEMVSSGKHADVVLFVTLNAEGKIRDVSLAESGGPAFDEAAMEAVRKWTFSPATVDGKPVPARIKVPFHFAPPAPPSAPTPGPVKPPPVKPPPAAKQPPAPAEELPPQPIEEVHVLGRTHLPKRGGGDFDMPIGHLAAVPHRDAGKMLESIPGVYVGNEGGEGHPYQIVMRGFDSQEGLAVETTLDGIPLNEVGNPHGNGLVDEHFIIPELVINLRALEGPFAPQQGNFAVAGSILYDVGLERTGLNVSGTYGSFNTRRLLLTYRPQGCTDRTFGGVELYGTDGYGQNRAANRATAMAGYEWHMGRYGYLRVLGTSYTAHYQQAGVVRRDDVNAGRVGFFDTYDPSQGGDSTRHSVGITFGDRFGATRITQSAFFTYREFGLRANETGFVEDVQQPWQSAHAQRGDLTDQHDTTFTVGGRGAARYRWKALGSRQEVELGYLARFDAVDSLVQRDRFGTNVPYLTDFSLASSISNIGVYVDANLKPTRWITVRGGARGELYDYVVRDRCAVPQPPAGVTGPPDTECFSVDEQGYRNPQQTTSEQAGAFLPRGTVMLGPWRGFTFSGSVGAGTRSLDPLYIAQTADATPPEIIAYEGGVSYQRPIGSVDLTARSVFFVTHVDKDVLFDQAENRITESTATTRSGWTGAVRATGAFFDVSASATFARSTFDLDHTLVPYVPPALLRLDGALFRSLFPIAHHRLEGRVGLGVSYAASRPLPEDTWSDPVGLVDLGASLTWRGFTLSGQLTNLLDTQYKSSEDTYASDFHTQAQPTTAPARHFVAGMPRAIFGTLSYTFGGGPT